MPYRFIKYILSSQLAEFKKLGEEFKESGENYDESAGEYEEF